MEMKIMVLEFSDHDASKFIFWSQTDFASIVGTFKVEMKFDQVCRSSKQGKGRTLSWNFT